MGAVYVRVSGVNSGLSATVQGSNDPMSVVAASANWVNLPLVPVTDSGGLVGAANGGSSLMGYTIVGPGTWRVNATGLARVRFNLASIATGTAVVNLSATQSPPVVTNGVNRDTGPIMYLSNLTFLGSLPQVSSLDQLNLDGTTVACNLNVTSYSSPGTGLLFGISTKDVASGKYIELIRSNPVAATGLTRIFVGKGAAVTSGVSAALIPGDTWATWITGAGGGQISGEMACDVVK